VFLSSKWGKDKLEIDKYEKMKKMKNMKKVGKSNFLKVFRTKIN